MLQMKPKPYVRASGAMQIGSSVMKVTYDDKKYIIVKCKMAYNSLKSIENSLNAFIRGGINNPEGLYFHFFNYIKKHPHKNFKVEKLIESDNAYDLLKREQQELYNGLNDRSFMNNQVTAYIPSYNEDNKAYGWIPAHSVLNFNNWLKKNKPPVVKPKKAKKTVV